MNGEGGEYGDADVSWLRGDFVTGIDTYSQGPLGYYPSLSLGDFYITTGFEGFVPPPEIFPTVRIEPTEGAAGFIDPEANLERTVAESTTAEAPRDFYDETPEASPVRLPTDPGGVSVRIPTYVPPEVTQVPLPPPPVLALPVPPAYTPAPVPREEEVVDWGELIGDVLGGVVGGVFDPLGLGDYARNQFVMGGPTGTVGPPAKVTVDTRTGKVTPCRRRRRRKLLTNGDFNDLLRISTLPNKDTVKIALAKAIR